MHEHRIVYEEVPGSRTTQETIIDPQRERIAYEELRPGTEVQAGDQYRNTQGRWVEYSLDTSGVPIVGPTTMARRPIGTAQQAVDQPQRERIAYEELQPGDVIQEGDEWRNEDGRWQPFTSLTGSRVQVRHSQRARRPYKISAILEIGDALADAQKAATQLQDERNEFQTALIESRLALKRKVAEVMEVCKERDEACKERDEALAEVAKLSAELWARKPLEDRVASLVEELANAREEIQKLIKTMAENADQFAEHTIKVVHERDEARAELRRLQEVVSNLYNEPTARQVQNMLRMWATELDWSAGCFDSAVREQIDGVQKTLIAVIERIECIIDPEGNSDGE